MTNHYLNLMAQVDKLNRHNRQGSFKTRARYYEAMQRFSLFLADTFRLERLANAAPKHIYAYVTHLQEGGKAASTIKTDLAAIRFYHDLIPNARYKLPANSDLNLQRRKFGEVDRTWSEAEGCWLVPWNVGEKTLFLFFIWGVTWVYASMSISESTPPQP